MKERTINFSKIRLSKVKSMKKIQLPKLPILLENDLTNINPNKMIPKNNLNSMRTLRTKLKLKHLKIKEDFKNSKKNVLNKLMSMKFINLFKNKKTFGQMAKEIAEKSMTHYLCGNYDMFEGAYETESESENYDISEEGEENEKIKENEKNKENSKPMITKKLNKNYSQDFITFRNRIIKDDTKIKQYEKLLLNNKLNRVEINIKNVNYKNLLSSYNALSQNKLICNNILKSYKGIMVSEFAKKITKLNPIIKLHENNINPNIKIFPIITKSMEINNKNDYFGNDDELPLDTENINNEELTSKNNLDENLYDKSLVYKRTRLYLLKNSYQYPLKNFPGSLSEFAITQNQKECILFGGHNTGKNPHVWKFNGYDRSWDIIKAIGTKTNARHGHTAVLNNKNLYIFGGLYTQLKTFANLEIFNLEAKKWVSPIFNTKNMVELRRNHVACSIGNCMLIQGGIDKNGEILSDCYLLNYQPLQWKIPSLKKGSIKISSLAYHCCCSVLPEWLREDPSFTIYKNLPEEKLKSISIKEIGIYIFGGKCSKSGIVNNNLYVLKIGGNELEWIILNTSGIPPKKRFGASMTFYETGNLLIIHGGRHNGKINFAYNDTFILDLYSLNWMKVEYFDKKKKVAKRYFHQSFVDTNYFYVFGGMNESNYLGSEMFILDLNSHKSCVNERKKYNILKIVKKSKNENESLPPVDNL